MQLTGHKTRSVFERHNIGSGGGLRTAAEQLRGLTGRGTERDNRGTRGIHAQPKARDCLAKVEAPSGFEPEMEVLQTGPTISMLLARFAFWLVLTCVLPGVRWVLFPDCSHVLGGGSIVGLLGNRTASQPTLFRILFPRLFRPFLRSCGAASRSGHVRADGVDLHWRVDVPNRNDPRLFLLKVRRVVDARSKKPQP